MKKSSGRRRREPDLYFDGFTGWHSRRDELAEAERVRRLEARLTNEAAQRQAPSLDGYATTPRDFSSEVTHLPKQDA